MKLRLMIWLREKLAQWRIRREIATDDYYDCQIAKCPHTPRNCFCTTYCGELYHAKHGKSE